jgi:hypothetical protein
VHDRCKIHKTCFVEKPKVKKSLRRWEDKMKVILRFSAAVHTDPGAYPASCTMGTGSFPGVKRPGRGVDHTPPSSAEVKERVELYLYSPSGPSWLVLRRILLYIIIL